MGLKFEYYVFSQCYDTFENKIVIIHNGMKSKFLLIYFGQLEGETKSKVFFLLFWYNYFFSFVTTKSWALELPREVSPVEQLVTLKIKKNDDINEVVLPRIVGLKVLHPNKLTTLSIQKHKEMFNQTPIV